MTDSKMHRDTTAIIQSPGLIKLDRATLAAAKLTIGDAVSLSVDADSCIRISALVQQHGDAVRDQAGVPIPPGHLIQPFTGNTDVESYLRQGKKLAQSIAQIVTKDGGDLAKMRRILDFGCGSARVLREIYPRTKAELHGCDLHCDAIDWNNSELPFGQFVYGTEYPPLPYPDEHFDCLYAISVLTHLDEEHQDQWLAEWKRVLAPGGRAVVTFKGSDFVENVVAKNNSKYGSVIRAALVEGSGICFQDSKVWAGILPDFYANAYHTDAYVREHWGQYFDVKDLIPAGQFEGIHQNAALLVKRKQ